VDGTTLIGVREMAERRMFAKSIVLSDAFLDMSLGSRALYMTLCMVSDDEGVVNNPKAIMRQCGVTEDDLKLLIVKKFVIPFDTQGLIVIKHWYIHNYIQKDRFKPSKYHELLANLTLDENNSYTCIHSVSKMDTQDRLEIEIGKSKDNIRHKYGTYNNVLFTDDQLSKLKEEFPNDWNERIERVSEYCASTGKSYKDYLATIRNWSKKDKPKYEDKIPTYDLSTNKKMSKEEEKELLKLMGKE